MKPQTAFQIMPLMPNLETTDACHWPHWTCPSSIKLVLPGFYPWHKTRDIAYQAISLLVQHWEAPGDEAKWTSLPVGPAKHNRHACQDHFGLDQCTCTDFQHRFSALKERLAECWKMKTAPESKNYIGAHLTSYIPPAMFGPRICYVEQITRFILKPRAVAANSSCGVGSKWIFNNFINHVWSLLYEFTT